MPQTTDWCYAVAYSIGGEFAARLLNFVNLLADSSCLSDALAYEFFREAGCPAPRTASRARSKLRKGRPRLPGLASLPLVAT